MNEDPFSSSAEARLSGFFAWIKSNAISITLVLGLLIAAFFIYLYLQNKNEERLSEAFEAYQNIIDSFNNAVIAVQNGDVDGVIIDSTSAAAYEQEFAGELTVGITGLSSDPLGLVFQEGDSIQDAFNEGLAMIKDDGTLQKLVVKWWPK